MKVWWFGATGIGFTAAVVAAYVGVGGGVVLTPMLLLLFELRGIESPHLMQHIFATNMMFMLVSSSIASYRYRKIYPIKLGLIKWMLIGAALGALGGGSLAAYLPGHILKNIFGFVLILSSIRFLMPDKREENNSEIEIHPVLGLLGGMIAGGIAPLAGIGDQGCARWRRRGPASVASQFLSGYALFGRNAGLCGSGGPYRPDSGHNPLHRARPDSYPGLDHGTPEGGSAIAHRQWRPRI